MRTYEECHTKIEGITKMVIFCSYFHHCRIYSVRFYLSISGEMLVRPSTHPSVNRSQAESEQIWSIWPIMGLFEAYLSNFGLFWTYFSPVWTILANSGIFEPCSDHILPIMGLFEPYLTFSAFLAQFDNLAHS